MRNLRMLSTWLVAAAIAVTGISCSKSGSPTAPDTPDASSVSSPTAATPEPSPTPTPAAAPDPDDNCSNERAVAVVAVTHFSLSNGTATVKNNGSCSQWVGLALYDISAGFTNQVLVGHQFKTVGPKATAQLAVTILDSLCDYQLDLAAGLSGPIDAPFPNYSGHLVDTDAFGGNFGRGSGCTTQQKSCDQYTPPTFSGELEIDAGTTTATVSKGTTMPANCVFNPALPATVPLPDPPNSETFNTTCVASYGPADLNCTEPHIFSVEIPPREVQPCENVGEPTFTITKNEAETTAVVTTNLTFAAGNGSISLAPPPESGFSGGQVTSGVDNNSNYSRPGPGQAPKPVDASWEVREGETLCKSGSGLVTITPQSNSCENVALNVSVSVDGSSATVTATWNGSGTGTVSLDSGPPEPINSGVPKTYNQLPEGSHSVTVTVVDGQLTCSKTKEFTIEPERTCEDVNLQLQEPQVNGDSATCTATWNQPPSTGTMFLDNSNPQTVTNGNGTTYNNIPAGNHTCKVTIDDGPLHCEDEKPFTIEPERTCDDVNADVDCSVDGDDASCLATWTDPGNGQIKLDNGSFSNINNGGTKSYNNLPFGSHTVTLKVVDGQLTCQDTDSFAINCEDVNPPSSEFLGYNDSGGNLSGTVGLHNAGGWTIYLHASSSHSECDNNDPDYTKDEKTVNQACGDNSTKTVSYHWAGHPAEWWWVAWTHDTVPSAGGRSDCIRNTHN